MKYFNIFILFSVILFSQSDIDSLLNQSENVFADDPQLSFQIVNKAISIAESSGNDSILIKSKNKLAEIYYFSSYYDKSNEILNDLLNNYNKNYFPTLFAETYLLLGLNYQEKENYNVAIDDFNRSVDMFNSINDSASVGVVYNYIAETYTKQNLNDKAEVFYKKSININKQNNFNDALADSYNKLGLLYHNTGRTEEGIDYYKKALKYYEDNDSKINVAQTLNYIGLSYGNIGNYRDGYQYLNKAIQIYNELNHLKGKIESYKNLAYIQFLKNDYRSAFESLEEALEIQTDYYQQNIKQNQLDKVIKEINKDKEIVESEYQSEKEKNLRLEIKDKEQQIEIAQKNNLRNILVISLILVLIVAFFIYRSYKQKEKSNRLLEEKNRIITNDLQQASDYVNSLLPKPLKNDNIEIDWKFVPNSHLGGDIFGYHYISDNKMAIYLIDVSGHGVQAALHSVSALNTIKYQTLPNVDFAKPEEVLTGLNKNFQMSEHGDKFFTLWYGVIDFNTNIIKYSSAGHPPALAFNGETDELENDNFIIGGLPEFPFCSSEYKLMADTELFIYSDGVYEVQDQNNNLWDIGNLTKYLKSKLNENNLLDKLYNKLIEISGLNQLDDDFSILKIKIK